jgi:hypothetical protein
MVPPKLSVRASSPTRNSTVPVLSATP